MTAALPMVFRTAFVAALLALTLISWLVVGGRAGVLLWIASFLLLWGVTRLVDHALDGFFLGREAAPGTGTADHEEA